MIDQHEYNIVLGFDDNIQYVQHFTSCGLPQDHQYFYHNEDWLEDRKKLRKDWYNYLKAAEQKLKTLLKDRDWTITYPAIHDYLLQNEHSFNYNDIAHTVDMLSQTNLGEKNLIFGYSNKTMKEWATLKKYMDSNLLNLLSVAKFIEQSLRFDLPALSKSIEGFDNQLATLRRKIDFNQNTIFQQTNALAKEKVMLGVDNQQEQNLTIEQLIEFLIKKGPQQIVKFVALCQNPLISDYLSHYVSVGQQNQLDIGLDALAYFIENGDEFLEVSKDPCNAEPYSKLRKYKEFEEWRGSNEWDIQIQGEIKDEQSIDLSTIIQNRQFRQQLLYNLNELLFFYKGIKYEISSAAKGLGFQTDHFKGKNVVQGQANIAIQKLQEIISFLTSRRLTVPLELKSSKKAYQVLVSQFGGYEANIATMQEQIATYRQQIQQIEMKRQQQAEKLNWLRAKVVSSKSKCEGWLSEIVKKEVKITGEINKLE